VTFELNKKGPGVNRKRVRRLMRAMGIETLVPRPRTSKAAPGHKIYPNLLRSLKIVKPNHVCGRRDLHPGGVRLPLSGRDHRLGQPGSSGMAWRLSNTNDASFSAAALRGPFDSRSLLSMTTPIQPKSNPLPHPLLRQTQRSRVDPAPARLVHSDVLMRSRALSERRHRG
jgi:HTH-like domain